MANHRKRNRRRRNTLMSADRPALEPITPTLSGTSGTGNTGTGQLADLPLPQACKYVSSEGVCERYGGHIQNNDYSSANQEIQAFATQEGLTFQQANYLIQVCCGYRTGPPQDGKCDEDLWTSMPTGTVASGGKLNYCTRCASQNTNPSGLASNGNLPVILNSSFPYWSTTGNPANLRNYCQCCEDDTSGDFTCEIFLQLSPQLRDGLCQKWQQAQGNSVAMQSEINNLANILSVSDAYAQWILENCCNPCPEASPNSPYFTFPGFCDSDYCKDGQGNWLSPGHPDCVCCPGYTSVSTEPCPPQDPNSPFYTNDQEFCPQCQPGGYYYNINHPDCKCCFDTSTTTTTRYRCDAGGCLQCTPGAPASACPYTEPTCAGNCGRSIPTNPQYLSMSGTKTNHWVPLLVLGASLMVGLYISEYATKKLIK